MATNTSADFPRKIWHFGQWSDLVREGEVHCVFPEKKQCVIEIDRSLELAWVDDLHESRIEADRFAWEILVKRAYALLSKAESFKNPPKDRSEGV